MKLPEVLKNINDFADEQIIYIVIHDRIESDIVISDASDMKNLMKSIDGKEYHYLIEIFLAKEFIMGLMEEQGESYDVRDAAEKLYSYAINDA